MKRIDRLIGSLLVLLLLAGASQLLAQTADKALGGKETAVEEGVTAGVVASYLDNMGYVYEINTASNVPELSLTIRGENNQYDIRIFIDDERKVVYVCVNRFLYCPTSHPRHSPVMQRLMELNWKLLIGKYEWDKNDGEVRLSYTFSTENGVGYDAFETCFQVLIMTADQHYPELMKLMWGGPQEGVESPKIKPKPEAKPQPETKVEPPAKEEPVVQPLPQPEPEEPEGEEPEGEAPEEPSPALTEPEPEPQTEAE